MDEPPPAAATVNARLSASVILARPGAETVELFMLRRHARSVMAPLAHVFPGGTVRQDDCEGPWRTDALEADLAGRINARSDEQVDGPRALGLHVAALRELFEEAGVLLARTHDGCVLEVGADDPAQTARLETARRELQANACSLAHVLQAESLRPAFDLIVPFSHWVTPVGRPARFDTWFFVAAMPPRQEAIHCAIETTAGSWLTVQELLEGASVGRYEVVFATRSHLRRIETVRTAENLLAFAAQKSKLRVQPRLLPGEGDPDTRVVVDLQEPW